ncbi:hypothetical protein ACX40Y_05145 [Sphingomonas sp. RS6]
MRVLFYLPVITPNWFNDAVNHLIRAAAREHEVHVIVPVMWHGTGIGAPELQRCADLTEVRWHILNDPDHPSYRTRPDDPEALVAFVRELNPAYTICRSADVETPARFPGRVAYLMEGEYSPTLFAPLPIGGRLRIDWPDFFDFGEVPPLTPGQREWLREATGGEWFAHAKRLTSDRATDLAALGLPDDRRLVAMPLQYQGSDNFFGRLHGEQAPPDEAVARVAEGLGEDFLLVVSLHPIDIRERNRVPGLERIAAMDPRRVRIATVREEQYRGALTETLIRHSDGLAVAESKSISIAALLEKPILRLSTHATAPWVRAYTDPAAFAVALREGRADAPSLDDALVWYGYHYANNAFVPVTTSFDELIARIDRPHDPARWPRALGFAAAEAVPI